MRIQKLVRSLVCLSLLLALLPNPALSKVVQCVGKTRNPLCETHHTKESCLKAVDQDEPGHSASCIWLSNADTRRTYVYTISRGSTPMIRRQDLPALSHRDFCAVSATMTLPSSAKGSWGAYMRLDNGPDPKTSTAPWGNGTSPFATSGCTVGKGAPYRCTVTLVPPRNPPLPESLNHIDLYTEYFTSDQSRIKELRQLHGFGFLSPENVMSAVVDIDLIKCSDLSAAKKVPTGVVDTVLFGSSPYYSGYAFDAPYVLLDYKSYYITNVTSISWKVKAIKAVNENNTLTPLEVMALKENDFETWQNGCGQSTDCVPPKEKALGGTYCSGLRCSGKLDKIGPYSGRGYLLVSWPKVTTYASKKKVSYSNPVKSVYGKELVSVEIVPVYKFGASIPVPL